jgi:alpha-galactosidase
MVLSMTHLESMSEFSFWALFAAPLIVTTDIRDMSNKKDILLNAEVIAVNQDVVCVISILYTHV